MKLESSGSVSLCKGKNFLQSSFWALFKKNFGWESLFFRVGFQGFSFQFLLLIRRVAGTFSIAYSPFPSFEGLGASCDKKAFLRELSEGIQSFLPRGTLFLRWDLLWERDNLRNPFIKPKVCIQPSSTIILDLTQPTDQILACMKSKTRYNIRLGERKGVQVLLVGDDQLERWYTLYQETAKRDGILIHTFSYYRKLFDVAKKVDGDQDVRLYMAWHGDDLLAGIIVIFYQQVATYIYGASSSLKRNMMANYLLQWKVICDAKSVNCHTYDFYGIPSSLCSFDPQVGLYQFKVGFGGLVLHRCGAYDYPYSKIFYPLYRFMEGIRARSVLKMKARARAKVHLKSATE